METKIGKELLNIYNEHYENNDAFIEKWNKLLIGLNDEQKQSVSLAYQITIVFLNEYDETNNEYDLLLPLIYRLYKRNIIKVSKDKNMILGFEHPIDILIQFRDFKNKNNYNDYDMIYKFYLLKCSEVLS